MPCNTEDPQQLCNLVHDALQSGEYGSDIQLLRVCRQMSMIFVTALTKRIGIRARIMVGDAGSAPLLKLHPKMLALSLHERYEHDEVATRWQAKITEFFDEVKAVGTFRLAYVGSHRIDALIGVLDKVSLQCRVCSKAFTTCVNAQRCAVGHQHPERVTIDFARVWDDASLEVRQQMCANARDVAGLLIDRIKQPTPSQHLVILTMAATQPECGIYGEMLVEALEAASEGTYTISYDSKAPSPDLFTVEDQVALLAHEIASQIYYRSRIDHTKHAAPTDPFWGPLWHAQLERFGGDDKRMQAHVEDGLKTRVKMLCECPEITLPHLECFMLGRL